MLTERSHDSALGKFMVTGTQDLVSSSWTGGLNVLFDVDAVRNCRVLANNRYMSSASI